MDYLDKKIAIGIMGMDKDGYDQIMVLQGKLSRENGGLEFIAQGHEPFEMSENWLKRLKPVEESMGKEFEGADYCLIVGKI